MEMLAFSVQKPFKENHRTGVSGKTFHLLKSVVQAASSVQPGTFSKHTLCSASQKKKYEMCSHLAPNESLETIMGSSEYQ